MHWIKEWLCGPAGAGALLLTGVLLSLRLRFVQIRQLPQALRSIFACNRDACGCGAISPMQSVCTALAGTMGTGNIAGVAGAIALGGPGAVGWMWLAAFLGMATKYAEVALAVRCRRKNAQGEWVGGPMYVIGAVLGKKARPLAKAFCVCGVLASLGMGNAAQVNTLCGSLCTLVQTYGGRMDVSVLRLAAGGVLAVITALMVLGGMRRIACAAERIMPFVSTVYVLCMLAVIAAHAGRIIPALGMIFRAMLSPQAALGGAAGITLKTAIGMGVTRGIFTNEAGMGSSAIAHAAAHGAEPHTQGLWGIFEVFADTFVMCTLTALGILTSGCEIPYGQAAGAEVTMQAIATVFGGRMSALLITLCMACFALSTLLAWSYYGMRCMEYLWKGRGVRGYLWMFSLLTAPFAVMDAAQMWEMAEVFTVMMALCNIPVLCLSTFPWMKMEKKTDKHIAKRGFAGYTGE